MGITLIQADLLGSARGAAQDSDILAGRIVEIKNLLKGKIPPEALQDYLRRSH